MLKLAGFAGAPVIAAFAPFIILPVISRIVGSEGWANFSTGQSIGILGMVGVLFGWGVVGPVRIARSRSAHERAEILGESLRSRVLLACAAVPLAGVVTAIICQGAYRTESIAVAVAMTLGGLSPAWFCIGQGNPRALMIFDAAPKLAASVLMLPVVLLSGQVLWYPIALVLFTLPAVLAHWLIVRRDHDPTLATKRPMGAIVGALVPTAAIDATANAYGSTPIPIATAGLSAADASAFASADRIYRVGLLAVVAVGNAFQAWVLDPAGDDPARRQRMALSAHVGLGIVGGAMIALLGPWATAVLFGPAVAAQPIPSVLFGAAFLFISTATPLTRNLLIPDHRYRVVFGATIAAAATGLAVMLVGSASGSANLIALGVACAEATALAVIAVPALRAYRRVRASAVSPGAEQTT